MQFKVNDKAVYPAHGVGVITEIRVLKLDGDDHAVYVLKILGNAGSTIQVPVNNVDAVGMRKVISTEHIEKVYEILRDRDVPADNQTWNRRYREYMARIKTGDPLEVAKVLRDLALLRQDKTLSFGERKMYDQARSLLIQEIAVARDLDESEVVREIDSIFGAA